MKWASLWTLTVLLAAGCHSGTGSTMPVVDPFAAYGSTRIAPPGTGTYGVANQSPYYGGQGQVPAYQGGATAAADAANLVDATKTPKPSATTASWQSPTESTLAQNTLAAAADNSSVILASAESPIRVVERVGPITATEAEMHGMQVNDATAARPTWSSPAASIAMQQPAPTMQLVEPAPFTPAEGAIDIRTLPAPSSAPQPLPIRGYSPPSTTLPLKPLSPSTSTPHATIQAGRLIPLNIALDRSGQPAEASLAAAAGNP